MPRLTKDCDAQRALEKHIDDHTITAQTKAQTAYNLDTDIFHQFNFPAFQKHFDSTTRMRFGQSSCSSRRRHCGSISTAKACCRISDACRVCEQQDQR
ncbi:hypothetical protein Ae201684P_004950 [Aphanomyces euteiches]|nr:hypothetical protein Ae201684P_004950 [Aphanomyces euteiches]